MILFLLIHLMVSNPNQMIYQHGPAFASEAGCETARVVLAAREHVSVDTLECLQIIKDLPDNVESV